MPKIYKKLREFKSMDIQNVTPQPKNISRNTVKCDQCKFKATLIQMKMHLKNVHGPKLRRASKRLPNLLTPLAKSPKRSKNILAAHLDLKIISESILEESTLVDDTFSGKDCPLEEVATIEKVDENIGHYNNSVHDMSVCIVGVEEEILSQNMDGLLADKKSCGECDFISAIYLSIYLFPNI